jgi:hypothetical protein
MNKGKTLADIRRRAKITKSIKKLAAGFSTENKKTSLFSRLIEKN